MKHVLIVGMNPHTIDFSTPGILPGLTAEKILQGMETERENLRTAGYTTGIQLIDTGATDLSSLENHLMKNLHSGIMIGAGIRIPTSNFLLFEKIMNLVHKHAPQSVIIFNTNPTDTSDSIRRWL